MNNFSVMVLMSTYNGGRFLRQQLDSILKQDKVDVFLLVRDDGSKDETCIILEEYASKNCNIRWVEGNNLGFVRSFSELVKMALNNGVHTDYYAFADQDDVWFPEKLHTACSSLHFEDNSKPNLFTSNSMQIDAEGGEIGLFHKDSFPRYRRGNVLIYGTEQGCSMVFNRKALELYNLKEPTVTYHDRWIFFICFYLGTIRYNHNPLFYYRIHGGNAIGSIEKRILKNRWLNFLYQTIFGPPLNNHHAMAGEFFTSFNDKLSQSDIRLFMLYLKYRASAFSKIKMLFSREFICPYPQLKSRIFYFMCIMFNKI